MKTALYIFCLSLFLVACNVHSKEVKLHSENVALIDTLPGSCPFLTKDVNGNVVLSWVRSINDTSAVVCYAVSEDGGKTFGVPTIIPYSKNVHAHAENMP